MRITFTQTSRLLVVVGLFVALLCLISYSKRTLLVLYKSSEGHTARNNIFAWHIERFANDKGFQVRYHDIDQTFPPDELMRSVDAIVTVYTDPVMRQARAYIDWLAEQLLQKKKVVIVGNFGAFSPDGQSWIDTTLLNKVFYLLGLEFLGHWTNDPEQIRIGAYDPDMIGFETSLTPPMLREYFQIVSLRPENQVFLSLKRRGYPASDSALVVKTPTGGIALYYTFSQEDKQPPQQIVNLGYFVTTCLQQTFPDGMVPEKRVLALYKSAEEASPETSLIARFLAKELILAGYWPEYYPLEAEAAFPREMTRYHGIVTWFQTPFMENAEYYVEWLRSQIQDGRKVVILGNFGAFGRNYTRDGIAFPWFLSQDKLNRFFMPFGLEFLGDWIGDPDVLTVQSKAPDMVEHELALTPQDFHHYFYWKSVYPENTIYLKVGRRDLPMAESAFIVSTPFGGFAFEGYIYQHEPDSDQIRFFLNRAAFLRAGLDDSIRRPIADREK